MRVTKHVGNILYTTPLTLYRLVQLVISSGSLL